MINIDHSFLTTEHYTLHDPLKTRSSGHTSALVFGNLIPTIPKHILNSIFFLVFNTLLVLL